MASTRPQRSLAQQYAVSTATGAVFGASNTIVGHPFDTVKTKLQAQSGFGGSMSTVEACAAIWRADGALGFYRGCLPPMWGSAVYRSAQFAVFETLHARLAEVPALRQRLLPAVSDTEARTPLAGMAGATARTLLEQPIEYAKVKGQTGQQWVLREIYQGALLQWARTGPMMTFWFCAMEAAKRQGLTVNPLGAFLSSGGAALVGFWIVWPFETLKNQAQAGLKGTIPERVRALGGVSGLYRGILPGSLSVFLRNGAAMLVMRSANRKLAEWGLKD